MRFIISISFLFFVSISDAQTNSLFGIQTGYSNKGIYLGARINLNRIFYFDSSRFVTELSGNYSNKFYNDSFTIIMYPTNYTIQDIEGINSPGYVNLITVSFYAEEKYFVTKKHFISLIVGIQNNKTRMDSTIVLDASNNGVKVMCYTYNYSLGGLIINQKGSTISNTNQSLWNLFYGIGCGEKFGKHIQINSSLTYSLAKFSNSNSLFGKRLDDDGISNPYYIPLHFTAQLGMVFTFF